MLSNGSGVGGTPNAYDEYGVHKTVVAQFGYTGQMHLTAANLYHYKARAYSPALGRFMQTDPVGYDDQVNLYAYVGNDPFNNVDPTGMATEARNPAVGEQRGCGSLTRYDSAGCAGDTLLSILLSKANSSAPSKSTPGGKISDAQRKCRSCHGITTTDEDRYTTEEENDRLAEFASNFIPAIRISKLVSTGRRHARSYKELLAMKEVKSKPSGTEIPITLKDWRLEFGSKKMTQKVNRIEIHYVKLPDGKFTDFKFK